MGTGSVNIENTKNLTVLETHVKNNKGFEVAGILLQNSQNILIKNSTFLLNTNLGTQASALSVKQTKNLDINYS